MVNDVNNVNTAEHSNRTATVVGPSSPPVPLKLVKKIVKYTSVHRKLDDDFRTRIERVAQSVCIGGCAVDSYVGFPNVFLRKRPGIYHIIN